MIDLENYTENSHKWEHGETNEYCVHCGHIYESWLGGSSADNLECIERKISFSGLYQFPSKVVSYCNFRGLTFDKKTQTFNKPYDAISLSLKDMSLIINML